ncbi:DUF4418 family protein [uncultured Gilliamella sp.]|uniref:DUF4418 family protein n=1 Tax=uncultured Gilliamella sp. TaxID=1193505 RepID=UPI0025CC2844|nr:DUF4418 family protein [uncultured Gilliamella sp.]
MKNRLISSLLFIIIGALLILVPLYIVPVCPPPEVASMPTDMANHMMNHEMAHSPSGTIMKCFWTARAEVGIGIVVLAIGLLMLFSRTVFVRMGLSMALACISFFTAAIPTILIGVCPGAMMLCNMGTKPALILLSASLLVVAIINTLYLNKASKKLNFK